MYKQHKVILLPTKNNPNTLISDRCHLIINEEGNLYNPFKNEYYHLYILSDGVIEDNDYFMSLFYSYVLHNTDEWREKQKEFLLDTDLSVLKSHKIIATTDNTIYPKCDGHCATDECVCTYPQPTKEFIQHFIGEYNKGNVITDVEVEYLNLEPNNGGLILGVNQDNTVNIKVLDPAPKVYTEADVKYFMDVAVQWGRNESNYQKDHYQFIRETLNK